MKNDLGGNRNQSQIVGNQRLKPNLEIIDILPILLLHLAKRPGYYPSQFRPKIASRAAVAILANNSASSARSYYNYQIPPK